MRNLIAAQTSHKLVDALLDAQHVRVSGLQAKKAVVIRRPVVGS
jgi:hypothetical protein